KLDQLGITRDTLVIFLTDNGPQAFDKTQVRYNAGMRGAKGTVYEGGIRVPSFWRWPGTLDPGRCVDTMAANIDVLPTLLKIAGVPVPDNLDGQSLLPLLGRPTDRTDQTDQTRWNRYYFTQWHRGDVPEPFRACAVVSQRYKLVDGKELYDLVNDPSEQRDIAPEKPDVVAEMRSAYEWWFDDVSATRGYDPPRIAIGTPHENPVVLTRQDWRGDPGKEGTKCGHWLLDVATPGPYDITLTFNPLAQPAIVGFQLGDVTFEQEAETGAASCTFPNVTLTPGDARLDTWLTRDADKEGAYQIYVQKR
ncbi:MAG: sulfatase-like hydrolase/transferase, partial [Candidatus Hydrogenedentes bacterium]|nr:sulfatase-like hydrolase/transferase [Candidatus Hydrogenedentota bacterium]